MASDSIKGSEAHIDLYHSLDIIVVNFPHFSEVSDTGPCEPLVYITAFSLLHVFQNNTLFCQ